MELADEYGIRAWVTALLDPAPVYGDDAKKSIHPPPPFVFAAGGNGSGLGAPLTPAANSSRGRGRPRAGSPVKGTPATPGTTGKAASPRKRVPKAVKEAGVAAARQASESLQAAVDGAAAATEGAATAAKGAAKGAANALEKAAEPLVNGEKTPAPATTKKGKKKEKTATAGDEKVTVEVQSNLETNGDVEGERTTVKVSMPADSPQLPLPETTADMIATAKEMVAEARKIEEGDKKPVAKGKGKAKRKLDEVKDTDDEEGGAEPAAKKAKGMEQQIRKQQVRNRALVGVGLTLAVG